MKLQLPSENSNNTHLLAKIKQSQLLFILAFLFVGFSHAQTTVVCADGPVNTTFCYDNFDTTSFEFTSDTGFPLVLTFNAGTTENTWDEVIVLDSDGVTDLNAATPYGAGGQLSGLTFTSTGDTITLMINSDVSNSCVSGSQTAWDWDVFCLTCMPPAVDFISNNMCFTGQDFEIDVDVTDLGSTGTLTITDDQGSAPVVVTAVGTTTFGPYDPNIDVIFTVDNGDANCLIESDPIGCECEPPTVDFVSNNMCFPGQDWTVDVEITDLGGASSLNIFTIPATTAQTVTAVGTYTFGPFDPAAVVNIIVDGGVMDCVVPSGPISCECVEPIVDFISNDLCFPGQDWTIDVVITDLSGAPSLDIFDAAMTQPVQTTTVPGTFTFGPFPPGAVVNMIVDGGAFDCVATSGPIDCECVPPTATFSQDGLCETGQEFSVFVDITDLGGASTLTITDDQGNPAQTATAPGIFTFGTYPPGTTPIITIDGGNTDCVIDSGPINCLSTGECDIVNAGPDAFLDCDTDCVDLTASFLTTPFLDTTSYAIQGPVCDVPPLTGTPSGVISDDTWSSPIDMTFDFEFFGNTYSSLVVNGNGVVSFDLSNTGGSGYVMDPPDQLPLNDPPVYTLNSIFGALHDMDVSEGGEINFFVSGVAPYRIFVLNYNNIAHFSCNDISSTSQILLYESLNIIDVNIIEKPTCITWNDGLAAIGIQGNDITQFSVPEDRNVGVWEVAPGQSESWRFVPSGAPTTASAFEWRDINGTVLSNDLVLNVCPTETTTYVAALTVELPGGGFDEITDEVTVTKESGCGFFDCNDTLLFEDFGTGTGNETHPFTPLDFNDGTTQIDANQYTVSSVSTGLNDGWHNDMLDHTADDTDGQMIFFNPSENPTEIELYRRDVTVPTNTDHLFSFWMTTVYDIDTNICPNNGSPSRLIFRVEDMSGTVIATNNTNDVINQSDPQWLQFSLDFNSGANNQVQIVILNDIFGACGNDLAIDDIGVFAEGVPPVIIAPTNLELCDETGNDEATFDLTSTITELLDGLDPALHVVTFHNSQVDADTGDNDIPTPTAYINASNPETIFVRVEKLNQPNCFSTTNFELSITQAIVITTDLPAEVTFCPDESFTGLDATPTNAGIDLTTVTYSWEDAGGTIVSTDAIFTPAVSGTYTVTITVPPCSFTMISIDVIVNPVPTIDLGADATVCDNATFEIIPDITGDTTGATLLWSTGETTPTITVDTTGTYSLTITTVDGCEVTDEIVVTIADPIDVTIDSGNFESCEDFVTTITASASVANVTYQWFLNGVLLPGETNSSIGATYPAGATQAQVYNVVVTSPEGCMGEESINVTLAAPLDIMIDTDDFETCPGFETTINASASASGSTFQWLLNGDELAGETNSSIDVSLPANTTGIQTYTVLVMSPEGCEGEASIDISLFTDNANCVISQGISPNGDGINDVLNLEFLNNRSGIESVQIFNRLGREVFVFGNGYSNQFTGNTTDGDELPTGTYFYVIKLQNADQIFQDSATGSGWIYINREAN